MITQERLKELFVYNEETGYFVWKVSRKGYPKKGKIAGCLNPLGYVSIRVDSVLYQAHRLVFLYLYGAMPNDEIDHINGNRSDNRIFNLREASRSQNGMNMSLSCSNKSGVKGVSKSRNGWRGSIDSNGVQYQKRFKSFHDAVKWIDDMRKKLHGEFACNGGRLAI